MKEPHSKGPDKNLGVNYITNTGNDTGLTTVDIETTNQISNEYTHQGASRNNPLPLNSKQKVMLANIASIPSKPLQSTYGTTTEGVISFEHINVNGINPHNNFVELTHIMGSLEAMGASVYSINEKNGTQLVSIFVKTSNTPFRKRTSMPKWLFPPMKRRNLLAIGNQGALY